LDAVILQSSMSHGKAGGLTNQIVCFLSYFCK
jgi:hypothetical protein